MVRSWSHIQNEDAYNRAIADRIKENAIKGRAKRFDAEYPGLRERINAEVEGPAHPFAHLSTDEFYGAGDDIDPDYSSPSQSAEMAAYRKAIRAHRPNPFIVKMREALVQYGSLTAGQAAATLRVLDTDAVRKAERAAAYNAERAQQAATSLHVGVVGRREVFSGLTVKVYTTFETDYGLMHIHVMHDAAGNVLVYKGSNKLASKGDTITLKATVKEHSERDGIKQTVISRPKR